MRIRKHANISLPLYAPPYFLPVPAIQTLVCQLNQSPWDVINFSPPKSISPPPPTPSLQPLKVTKNAYFEINGSSGDSVSAILSEEIDDSNGGSEEETEEEDIIYCCKTDGKSWRCKREAFPGHSLCKHHLTMGTNLAPKKIKASAGTVEVNNVIKRRARPKKKKKKKVSNPYEYYYYSGFGPSWGKKRGVVKTVDVNGYGMQEDLENGCHHELEEDDEHERKVAMVMVSSFEGGDEDNNECRKKRPRKPIKARSLKSLM